MAKSRWREYDQVQNDLLARFPTKDELAKAQRSTLQAFAPGLPRATAAWVLGAEEAQQGRPHPFQQWNGTVGVKPTLPSLKLEGYPSGRDRAFRLTLNRTAVLMLLAALPHLLDPKLKPYPAGKLVFTSLTPGAEHANIELRLEAEAPSGTTPSAG